jgi:hypothetical protein
MHSVEIIANYSRRRGAIDVRKDSLVRHDCGGTSGAGESDVPISEARANPFHDAWKEFLASTGPYSHMWTQSFMNPYGDRKSIDALWDCTKYINRSIWGSRWSKKGNGIHATVVAERHRKSYEMRGRLHFHVLVQKPEAGICDERFISLVNDAALWLRDDFGRPMSALDRTDVRKVYDSCGLASYLAKDLQTPHWPNGDNIFFLRPGGVEGVVFNVKNGAELTPHH